jgi:hypothetical protein
MTIHLKDIIDGRLIKDVFLDGHDIPVDKTVLECIDLYRIIIPSIDAGPDTPFVFDINGIFKLCNL